MENNLRDAQMVMLDILIKVDEICRKHNLNYFLDWGTLLGAVRHKGFIPWDDDIDISMPREDFEKFKMVAQKDLGQDYFLQTPQTEKQYTYYHIPMKVRHNKSLFLESVETGREKFNKGIYIDIFPLDYVPINKFKYKLQSIYKFIMERNTLLDMKFNDFSMQRKLVYPIVYVFIKCTTVDSRAKIEKWFIERGAKDTETYMAGVEVYWSNKYKKSDIFPLKEIEFEGKSFKAPNNYNNILNDLYGNYMELPPEEKRFWHSKKIEIYN